MYLETYSMEELMELMYIEQWFDRCYFSIMPELRLQGL